MHPCRLFWLCPTGRKANAEHTEENTYPIDLGTPKDTPRRADYENVANKKSLYNKEDWRQGCSLYLFNKIKKKKTNTQAGAFSLNGMKRETQNSNYFKETGLQQ